MEIIVKRWEHINSAFKNWDTPKGKYIRSKRHYYNVLKKSGLIPYEEACRIAEKNSVEKKWVPSKDCIEMMNSVMGKGDKNGKIVLGQHPKLVEAMKKKGMTFELPDWCPKHYSKEGGFDASKD